MAADTPLTDIKAGVSFSGEKSVKEQMDKLFEYKAAAEGARRKAYKLLLNSIYGRLRYDSSKYNTIKYIETKERLMERISEGQLISKYEPLTEGYYVY